MDKRIEILMNNLPDDMDAALLSGYDILRYYTRQSVPDSFLMVTRWTKKPLQPPTSLSAIFCVSYFKTSLNFIEPYS